MTSVEPAVEQAVEQPMVPVAEQAAGAGDEARLSPPGRREDGRLRDVVDQDDERSARAAWSALCEPGDSDAQRFVSRHGPVGGLARLLAGRGEPRWQVRLPTVNPHRDVATAARFGGRLVAPGDDEWPAGLAALGVEAPHCLWVRGPLHLGDSTLSAAALVGARAASDYGQRVAAELALGCAERGITVVSGAAYGIDAAAHRGALAAPGPTIAVLACGVDRAYPRGNQRLLDAIAATGAVVSEVPPGRAPTRWRFVERNRLIAALSRVTVVVEATHRSGALGTASRAARANILVAAVPGPVTSPTSYGTNQLIRDRKAECVTNAAELAELAGRIGDHLVQPAAPPRDALHGLRARERLVVDALPRRRPAAIPSLSRAAGIEEGEVMIALGVLEASGLARRDGPGWRRA